MRVLVKTGAILSCGFVLLTTSVWAKTIKIPKGAIDVNQLHDELLSRFPAWRGAQRPNGTFVDPLLRVEHTDREILFTMPETADDAEVRAVIAAHVPTPRDGSAPTAAPGEVPAASLEQRVERLEDMLGVQ